MTNKTKELQAALLEAENKVSNLFKVGKIPTPSDYADVDLIKKELKVARRVLSLDAKRTEPKKTSRFSILLPDEELNILTAKAKESGLGFSQYIRHLLKIALGVEEKARIKSQSGDS